MLRGRWYRGVAPGCYGLVGSGACGGGSGEALGEGACEGGPYEGVVLRGRWYCGVAPGC